MLLKGDYRLARVTNVHPDHNGMVRTATVSMRPRDSREKVLSKPPYLNPKQAVELVVGVQRLVVILPIEEQSDNNHILTVPDKSKNNSPEEDEPSFCGFDQDEIKCSTDRKTKLAEVIADLED